MAKEEKTVFIKKDRRSISERLYRHKLWCEGHEDGEKIDLSNENLKDKNLSHVDLSGVNLSGSNADGADMRGTDLTDANLSGTDLKWTNLEGATGKFICQFFFGKDYGHYADGEISIGDRTHTVRHWLANHKRLLHEMGYALHEITFYGELLRFIEKQARTKG